MSALFEDASVESAAPAAVWESPAPWYLRAIESVSVYLPVLLMAGLALGTWWLVKNTPLFENGRVAAPLRHEPDYSMTQFQIQRFATDGAMRAQIEGDTLRHFPDTDTFEVDNPRIRTIDDTGRLMVATARSALSNRDGSEIQLSGGAHVVREATATEAAVDFRSEFLHCFRYSERVQSHLPVAVTQGGTEIRADAMAYDHLAGIADLKGRVRAVLPAPGEGSRR